MLPTARATSCVVLRIAPTGETAITLGGAEGFDLALNGETFESIGLDLAHTLTGDAETAADLLERLGLDVAVQAVAQLDDIALALRELGHGAAENVHVEADRDSLFGPGLLACHELAERRLRVGHRPVEAGDRAGSLAHLAHLLQGELRDFRHLV